jgi:plasmid stabilization system protein ParE
VRVVFTSSAEQALEQIADFIAQDSPLRAISFIDELREKALGLARSPRAFPLAPRYEALGVRRRVHGRYLIFYRVEAEAIVILHILHGAQDIDRLLFPEE